MGSTFYVLVSLSSVLNHRFGFVSGSVFGVSVACVLTVCLAGWQRGIAEIITVFIINCGKSGALAL